MVASLDQNPVFQQQPDAKGNSWAFNLTLNEEAGIATTLTGMSINGVDYTPQIASLFGSASIPAAGSITANIGLANIAAPANVPFTFTGVDASGAQWSQQLSVPFQGFQTQLSVAGVSNAATGQQVYAPGMILSIYGAALGTFVESAYTVPLPQYLAGFEATINGVTAPIYYASPTQVNVQIPYETQSGRATLVIWNPYTSVTYRFQVAASAPGIFTFSDGTINPYRSASRGQRNRDVYHGGWGRYARARNRSDAVSPCGHANAEADGFDNGGRRDGSGLEHRVQGHPERFGGSYTD